MTDQTQNPEVKNVVIKYTADTSEIDNLVINPVATVDLLVQTAVMLRQNTGMGSTIIADEDQELYSLLIEKATAIAKLIRH